MEAKKRNARFYLTEDSQEPAKEWIDSLKDKTVVAKIFTRIRRAENGNFGDHKSLGDGVGELRITYGPGYRIYYGIDDCGELIILLMGGDKSSQEKDILKAKIFWRDYKNRKDL